MPVSLWETLKVLQRIADRSGRALYPHEVKHIAYDVYPEAAPIPKRRRKGPQVGPRTLSAEWEGCHEKYREDTFTFIIDKIVKTMSAQRLARGLPPAENPEEKDEYRLGADDGKYCIAPWSECAEATPDNRCCSTSIGQCQQGHRSSNPSLPEDLLH